MENNFFRPAGSLADGVKPENDFFRPAGSLNDKVKTENSFFRPAGSLADGVKPENDFFRPAGSLNETVDKVDDINDYLLTVVSGKKYDNVCELGVLMGAGRTIVGLEQLKQMVDNGYNIVNANVINASAGMIEIEYQEYKYDEELMERRRRF